MFLLLLVALVELGALLVGCDQRPTRRQILSDQAQDIAKAFGEVYSRLQVSTNLDVTVVLHQIDVEEGSAFLNCPIHHVRYQIDLDTYKWRNRDLFSTDIAMFCPIPHEGMYLNARFNFSFVPVSTYPRFQKR